jgi:hypothetical protein
LRRAAGSEGYAMLHAVAAVTFFQLPERLKMLQEDDDLGNLRGRANFRSFVAVLPAAKPKP